MLQLYPGTARRRAVVGRPALGSRLPAAMSSAMSAGTRHVRGSGRALTLLAFSGFAVAGVLGKFAYAQGAEPLSLLVVRFAAAVLVLVLLGRRQLLAIPRRTIAILLALGTVCTGQSMAFYSAVEVAPVGLVVVVVAIYPVIVMLLDSLLARRVPSVARLSLLGVALAGLWLAAGMPTGRLDLGVLLALVCAFVYATYMRLSEPLLAGVPPLVATTWVTVGGLISAVVLVPLVVPSWPTAAGVGIAALHGAIATALPVVALYAAVQRMGATQVASLGPAEPIMATALAAVALGEPVTAVQVAGGVLVLSTVAALAGVRPRAVLPRVPGAAGLRRRPLPRPRPRVRVRPVLRRRVEESRV